MARAKSDAPETVELVSPDGKIKRTVDVGSATETKLRWDGYLPAKQQKLEAPKVEAPQAPKTVGTNA